MKVLEKRPVWSLKIRCTGKGNGDGGCESLLLVEETDIFITSHSDYVGDTTDYYFTICCPICNKKTDIPEKDLPYSIKKEKLNEYKKSYQRTYGWER